MKAKVYDLKGNVVEEIELPKVFETPYRPDLIRRAYLAIFTHRRQPYGPEPDAGNKRVARSRGAGYGLARVPRTAQMVAANVPSAVGGRRAHPPRPEKNLYERLNDKERLLATASAIAATAKRHIVEARGHRIRDVPSLPLIVTDDLETIKKTKELKEVLKALGLGEELKRATRKIRAGRGKMRGRRYKEKKSVLIVVGVDDGIKKAAEGIPGVDVVLAKDLSVLHLAPGGHAGRITIYTKNAIDVLSKRFSSL